MRKFLPLLGGFSYRHSDLEGFLQGLYRGDLVHLSDVGLDIFNTGLQNILERVMAFGGHVSSGRTMFNSLG